MWSNWQTYNTLFFIKYYKHEACVKWKLIFAFLIFSWNVCKSIFKRPHGINMCAIIEHSLNNVEWKLLQIQITQNRYPQIVSNRQRKRLIDLCSTCYEKCMVVQLYVCALTHSLLLWGLFPYFFTDITLTYALQRLPPCS